MQGDESKVDVVESDVTDDDSVPAVVHGFKPGDVVQRKDGSARMTVRSVSESGEVKLDWIDGNNAVVQEKADASELELATDGLVAAAEKLSPEVVEGAPAGTQVADEEDDGLPEESPDGVQVTPPADEAAAEAPAASEEAPAASEEAPAASEEAPAASEESPAPAEDAAELEDEEEEEAEVDEEAPKDAPGGEEK